jgi:hypothetical protein
MTTSLKLCSACTWRRVEVGGDRCQSPEVMRREGGSLVNGIPTGWRGNCSLQREDNWFASIVMGTCGRRGRWWTAA